MEKSVLSGSFVEKSPRPPFTLAEVMAIFDELADRADIAFGHPDNGCYDRCHLMGESLKEKNCTLKKAWAFQRNHNELLSVDFPAGKKMGWKIHMAPVVLVEMPDKTVHEMVLDPGLFNGPVTVKEWAAVMKADETQIQVVTYGEDPSGRDAQERRKPKKELDLIAQENMLEWLPLQDKNGRQLFPSKSRQLLATIMPVPMVGKTWRTAEEKHLLFSCLKKGIEGKVRI